MQFRMLNNEKFDLCRSQIIVIKESKLIQLTGNIATFLIWETQLMHKLIKVYVKASL
jgi:hypothetical protein